MLNLPLLSLLIFIPMIGTVFIAFLAKGSHQQTVDNSLAVALWVSLVNFFLSLVLTFHFDPNQAGYQFEEKLNWLPQLNISYHVGIDGISLPLIVLNCLLAILALLYVKKSVKERVKEFVILFLLMQSFIIGSFCALDLILFYFFFEVMLIPMFIVIGIYGGKYRLYASFKFFL